MNTVEQLTQVFNDNFVAYFHSHVAHVNIVGRNFTSDHALLGGVYEDLQDQIDTIGELLRSLGAFMPNNFAVILADSHLSDVDVEGTADELLTGVLDDLIHLKGCYEELIAVATLDGHDEIANYAQDRVLKLAKDIWMFQSTLG